MASPDRNIPELDELIRANPAYRDTPVAGGESRAGTSTRRPTRVQPSPRLPWRLFGLPAPRAVIRALLIDGYPRELRRWAFERLDNAFILLAMAFGMGVAAFVAWFATKLEWRPAGVLLLVLAAAAVPFGLAMARLLPILAALRYAARWRKNMRNQVDRHR